MYIGHTDHGVHMEVRGQLCGVHYLLLHIICIGSGMNSNSYISKKYLTGKPSAPVTCFLSDNSHSDTLDLKSQSTFNLWILDTF